MSPKLAARITIVLAAAFIVILALLHCIEPARSVRTRQREAAT